MLFYSVLAILILTIGITTSLFIFETIRCPLGVFTIVWNGLFFLYSLNLVKFFSISGKAVIVIIVSYLIFYFGASTQGLMYKKIKKEQKEQNNSLQENYGNIKVIKKGIELAIVLSAVGGILWFIQAISIMGFISISEIDAYYLRSKLLPQMNGLYTFLVYVCSLGGCILIGLLLSKHKTFSKKYLLIFIGPLIIAFFIGQRNFIIIESLFIIAPLIITKNRKINVKKSKKPDNKNAIFILISITLFFIVIGNMRMSGTDSINVDGSERNIISSTLSYLTGPFVAFSEVHESWDGTLDYGVNTFTPIAKFLDVVGIKDYDNNLITQIENGRDPIYIPNLFNVFSYIWDVISDFGYIGLLIFNWLLGFLSSMLWYKFNKKKLITSADILFVFIMVYLLYGFVASITNYVLVFYGVGYALFVVWISNRLVRSIPHR